MREKIQKSQSTCLAQTRISIHVSLSNPPKSEFSKRKSKTWFGTKDNKSERPYCTQSKQVSVTASFSLEFLNALSVNKGWALLGKDEKFMPLLHLFQYMLVCFPLELGWGDCSTLGPVVVCVCAQSLSRVRLFATPRTIAQQALLSVRLPRYMECVNISSSRGSS